MKLILANNMVHEQLGGCCGGSRHVLAEVETLWGNRHESIVGTSTHMQRSFVSKQNLGGCRLVPAGVNRVLPYHVDERYGYYPSNHCRLQ